MPYWNRPDERFVDFEASRFVVAADAGLPLSTGCLERGSAVPKDALDARTLRFEYKVHRIELATYAATDPDLREACARRGVTLEDAPASQPAAPAKIFDKLDTLSRGELTKLCERYGLSTTGSKDELRQRLTVSTVG